MERRTRDLKVTYEEEVNAEATWQAQIRDLRRELQQAEAANQAGDSDSTARGTVNVAAGPHGLQARLRAKCAEVKQLREELNGAEEAIGMLVAGGNGGSGGLA